MSIKTAEEFLNEKGLANWESFSKADVISLINERAAQFQSPAPSDEDIYSYINGLGILDHSHRADMQMIAEWVREKALSLSNGKESDAVEFAEWLKMQNWSYVHSKKEWKPWENGHVFHNDPGKTTAQLYKLFKDSKEGK